MEPSELLDKTRYQRPSRALTPEKEAVLSAALARLADIVAKRGTPVKAFFDDAAKDPNSPKYFGHVTMPQLLQCLRAKLDLDVDEAEAQVCARVRPQGGRRDRGTAGRVGWGGDWDKKRCSLHRAGSQFFEQRRLD